MNPFQVSNEEAVKAFSRSMECKHYSICDSGYGTKSCIRCRKVMTAEELKEYK